MGERVVATFTGFLDEIAGEAAVQAFVAAVGSDQVIAVFDIRSMKGYTSAARRAWARAMGPIRSQLDRIELIGGNALVRMGGSVLGALIGVPVVSIRRERQDVA